MTDYNDGKWHGWNGGECPLHPETRGEFVFSDGCIRSLKPAGDWEWDCKQLPLIAFRVTKEHKDPRDFWIKGGVAYGAFVKGAVHVREVLE